MSRTPPAGPRPLNLNPKRLDRRLRGYAAGIRAANAPELGQVVGIDVGGVPARIDWFTIVSENSDYLECTRRDTATTIRVLKPPTLRGFISTTTLSGGNVHEITPAYEADDVVYGCSVPGATDIGQVDSGRTRPYDFVDLNVDGRQLARVPT